jgi:hypothetical protein
MTRQLIFDLENDNARGQAGKVGKAEFSNSNPTQPQVTGQCAQVLGPIRQHQPLRFTADYAIPEAAARVHNLRNIGFNITATILPEVEFRGVIRRNAAFYSLGSPEWPRPGFFENEEVSE